MYGKAARTYKQVDVRSATKPQVLDRLYERLLRDLSQAQQSITAGDVHGKAASLEHGHRIVTELQTALDDKTAPELCANLHALYEFVAHQMTTASLDLDARPLDSAKHVISDLRSAFREAGNQQ